MEKNTSYPTPIQEFTGISQEIFHLTFSTNGTYIGAATRTGTIKIWNRWSSELYYDGKLQASNLASTVFLSDDTLLVAAYNRPDSFLQQNKNKYVAENIDGAVQIFNAKDSSIIKLIGHVGGVTGAIFTPDGAFLITTDYEWQVRLWDIETNKVMASLFWNGGKQLRGTLPVRNDLMAVSSTGKYIVLCCDAFRHNIQVWHIDFASCSLEKLVNLTNSSFIQGITISHDEEFCAFQFEHSVEVYKLPEMQLVKTVVSPVSEEKNTNIGILRVAFSSNSQYLAIITDDAKAWIWKKSTEQFVSEIQAHTNYWEIDDSEQFLSISSIAWTPDDTGYATGGYCSNSNTFPDFCVRLWDFY